MLSTMSSTEPVGPGPPTSMATAASSVAGGAADAFSDKDLKCGVCREFLKAAVTIHHPGCEHSFCSECIRRRFRRQQQSAVRQLSCPYCQCKLPNTIRSLLQPNRALQEAVFHFEQTQQMQQAQEQSSSTSPVAMTGARQSSRRRAMNTTPVVGTPSMGVATITPTRRDFQPLAPRTQIRFKGLKRPQLIKLCQQDNLNTDGSEDHLKNRLQLFLDIWNANTDNLVNPKQPREVVREVHQREFETRQAAFSSRHSSSGGSGSRLLKQLRERGTTDDATFNAAWKEGFATLIAQVKEQQKRERSNKPAKKQVADSNESATAMPENPTANAIAPTSNGSKQATPGAVARAPLTNPYAVPLSSTPAKKDNHVSPSSGTRKNTPSKTSSTGEPSAPISASFSSGAVHTFSAATAVSNPYAVPLSSTPAKENHVSTSSGIGRDIPSKTSVFGEPSAPAISPFSSGAAPTISAPAVLSNLYAVPISSSRSSTPSGIRVDTIENSVPATPDGSRKLAATSSVGFTTNVSAPAELSNPRAAPISSMDLNFPPGMTEDARDRVLRKLAAASFSGGSTTNDSAPTKLSTPSAAPTSFVAGTPSYELTPSKVPTPYGSSKKDAAPPAPSVGWATAASTPVALPNHAAPSPVNIGSVNSPLDVDRYRSLTPTVGRTRHRTSHPPSGAAPNRKRPTSSYNDSSRMGKSPRNSIIGPWNCERCTFHNTTRTNSRATCEMCEAPRPRPSP